MSDSLKACPFCGEKAIIHQSWNEWYGVGCVNKCRGTVQESVQYKTEKEAREAWNRREHEH